MKKGLLYGAIGLLVIIFVFYCVTLTNYHFSVEGAWHELERNEHGIIIAPNGRDDGTAYIIHEDGSISFAIAYHTDIIVLYKDFVIYPTNLNINEIPSIDEYHFSKVKNYNVYNMWLGLVSNPNVEYTKYDKKYEYDTKQHVINLDKYSNSSKLKGLKLFSKGYESVELLLLDDNQNEVQLKKRIK